MFKLIQIRTEDIKGGSRFKILCHFPDSIHQGQWEMAHCVKGFKGSSAQAIQYYINTQDCHPISVYDVKIVSNHTRTTS